MELEQISKEIKDSLCEYETKFLSPYATKSENTLGRLKTIPPDMFRSEFVRDRDRIIHCKAFRRLKHKTQVFLSPEGDHYRTRLTHTFEVSQIARSIARALRLNEDLTEAIALGHDLGHTPFGHAGERALRQYLPFEHNEQSLRVVDVLEYDFKGMNLTSEVRDGILHHKKSGCPATLEGKVVSYADRIAYINHDIDDAVRAGLLKESDLPIEHCQILDCIGASINPHATRINNMIQDIIKNSYMQPQVKMSEQFEMAMDGLRDYMFEHIYTKSVAKSEETKAIKMLEVLFEYYFADLSRLPKEFQALECSDEQKVADFLSNFTDNYAVRMFENLFVPKGWSDLN